MTDPKQAYVDAAVRALEDTDGVVWATERDGGIVVGAKPTNDVQETVEEFNLSIIDTEDFGPYGVNYWIDI